MERRAFLGVVAGGLLAAPPAVEAQTVGKMYRIGYLGYSSPTLERDLVEEFRQGLRNLGYLEGQNLVLEYRSAGGKREQLPELAAELVRLKVDVIVTLATPAALAAKQATNTIPIVVAVMADPVGDGLVASLSRPGGNVTGSTFLGGPSAHTSLAAATAERDGPPSRGRPSTRVTARVVDSSVRFGVPMPPV
jgi:putative tryptophan/tyrosine transport system substrate-binding protein